MVNHSALESIKAVRPITNPIWKMAITLSEYNSLKACLRQAYYERNLVFYPIEAAICYAEWWKTEYNGKKASESEIAKAMGLPGSAGADLYNAAKSALALWRIPIIKHRNQLHLQCLLTLDFIHICDIVCRHIIEIAMHHFFGLIIDRCSSNQSTT